ncbi:MAG: GtrA family protein [Candidatus Puniceispirillum sp.]|jgi:putative flippase GtrA
MMPKIEFGRMIKFGSVGLVATLVHLISAQIALLITQKVMLSTIIGFVPAFIFSYCGHRFFTFSDALNGSVLRFFVVAVSGLIFSLFALSMLDQIYPWLGLTLSISVIPVWTYLMSRMWVFGFGQEPDTYD